MMMSFDFDYQHALRQAIVFSIFCEESLVRDIRIYSKERRGALLFLGFQMRRLIGGGAL